MIQKFRCPECGGEFELEERGLLDAITPGLLRCPQCGYTATRAGDEAELALTKPLRATVQVDKAVSLDSEASLFRGGWLPPKVTVHMPASREAKIVGVVSGAVGGLLAVFGGNVGLSVVAGILALGVVFFFWLGWTVVLDSEAIEVRGKRIARSGVKMLRSKAWTTAHLVEAELESGETVVLCGFETAEEALYLIRELEGHLRLEPAPGFEPVALLGTGESNDPVSQ